MEALTRPSPAAHSEQQQQQQEQQHLFALHYKFYNRCQY